MTHRPVAPSSVAVRPTRRVFRTARHVAVLLLAASAGTMAIAQGTASPYAKLGQGSCSEPSLACARSATPAFAPDGTLWVVWNAGGAVSIARSSDRGKTFGPPTVLARHGLQLDVGPDARPQVAISSRGNLAIAYAFFKDDAWNAQINTIVSRDGGRTFSTPTPLSTTSESQRFPSLAFDRDNRVFVAWIDKAATPAAPAAPAAHAGHGGHGGGDPSTVAYAWSDDGGERFARRETLVGASCDCCRLGASLGPTGKPVVAYRAIFGKNLRDHATTAFGADDRPLTTTRVSEDNWATDVCPHHGPAVAMSSTGTSHVAWFTQGSARTGLFYARAVAGQAYDTPRALGNAANFPGRPTVLTIDRAVWVAWKEFDGKQAHVYAQRSSDDGATWTAAVEIAKATGYNDHPLLTRYRDEAYLSWVSQESGYRLIALGGRL